VLADGLSIVMLSVEAKPQTAVAATRTESHPQAHPSPETKGAADLRAKAPQSHPPPRRAQGDVHEEFPGTIEVCAGFMQPTYVVGTPSVHVASQLVYDGSSADFVIVLSPQFAPPAIARPTRQVPVLFHSTAHFGEP
jgi:hypothetical protein